MIDKKLSEIFKKDVLTLNKGNSSLEVWNRSIMEKNTYWTNWFRYLSNVQAKDLLQVEYSLNVKEN